MKIRLPHPRVWKDPGRDDTETYDKRDNQKHQNRGKIHEK